MNTDIRFHGLSRSEALRRYTMRLVEAHLRRFDTTLTRVIVRFGDLNGPRGGMDKRCRITVQGARMRSATLDEVGSDPYAAAALAVERVTRAVERRVSRARALLTHGRRSAGSPTSRAREL